MESLLNVRLAEARRTKRSVAKEVGVSPETVWRWSTDSGIGGLCLRDADRLARAIGCDTKDLFR
jgi:DNA-binding XRE family transcriptional regulator